jgi:hypothetical protein
MAYINADHPHREAHPSGRGSPQHAAGGRPTGAAVWSAARTLRESGQTRRGRLVWPLVADDMFRLAHRDHDGALLLHADAVGLGLAAALLAELLIARRVTIRNGLVVVIDTAPPIDALAHTVLDHLTGEAAAHPVRTWLTFLARTAHEDVALRLLRAGHVREEASRRLLSRSVRYVPTDINTAAWPWARLSQLLRAGRQLDDVDTILGGLVLATDLYRKVLLGSTADLSAGLRAVVAHSPVAAQELLSHTEAAVGDAIITHS